MVHLIQASANHELQLVAELFREYAREIALDLCFQNFEKELRTLPGKYAPPAGRLYLLFDDDVAAGCGALRPLETSDPLAAEMKRLYIRPKFRKRRFARLLTERLIQDARQIGYRAIYLDTLASMTAARSLYASLGFVETKAYYQNPSPDVCYLKLNLTSV
jgi:ribosomal protein S18 acetylase RimI-like enzyme